MEKQTAINILEDIQYSLQGCDWKDKGLKTITTYIKGLKIATDENIKKLIQKHCEYIENYGEYDRKTITLSKKIDKEIKKIYNEKI